MARAGALNVGGVREPVARVLAVLATVVALGAPARGVAQTPAQRFQTEGRIDGIFSENTAAHAGIGLSFPAGLYVRTGVVAGAGVGRHGVDARTDLIGRFSFDPLRQSRWAPYGGAGVSVRFNSTAEGGAKEYLLFFLGVEGPLPLGRPAGWVPAFEVGLGGGTRVGAVIRKGVRGRR
ncbi:MAG TPA: hypothetical protein VFS56_08850 [Gemmatimonadaceae bacterium]|nr:hypothetical protein [Gemmatimonadaceae bacterium]